MLTATQQHVLHLSQVSGCIGWLEISELVSSFVKMRGDRLTGRLRAAWSVVGVF